MSSRNDKPVGIEALTKVAELDAAEKAVMNANIETAVENASTALETANIAAENASTALETANAIDAKATEALSTANTAAENASTALETANAVDAKATEALSTANEAKTTADGIDAKATEALSTANAASTTASTASTTADTALTTANAAASTAANVSAVATEAKSLAQSANTTSNTALQAATAANTAISIINGNDTGMSMRQVAETVAAGLIKPKGSAAFASLPLLETTALGDMYEVTDAFVTTADFKNGAGVSCDPGTEIYVVDVSDNKMWDLLGLKIDLSAYQKKALSVQIAGQTTVEGALGTLNTTKQGALTAGDGISITNNEISVINRLEKKSVLPIASINELGNQYLYIGETTSTLKKGGIYECISDEESIPTYSWRLISVSPFDDSIPSNASASNKLVTQSETGNLSVLETANKTNLVSAINEVNDKAEDNTLNFAPAFSEVTSYAVGDYVTYNNILYRCTTAHTAGVWVAGHFTQVTVGGELIVSNGEGIFTFLMPRSTIIISDNKYTKIGKLVIASATITVTASESNNDYIIVSSPIRPNNGVIAFGFWSIDNIGGIISTNPFTSIWFLDETGHEFNIGQKSLDLNEPIHITIGYFGD